jgi:hypothetical protein
VSSAQPIWNPIERHYTTKNPGRKGPQAMELRQMAKVLEIETYFWSVEDCGG